MILGRRKKSKEREQPRVVPTEPPLFRELERLGLVVVVSEQESRAPVTKPKSRRRPVR